MVGVILAAGMGTRFQFHKNIHKALIEIESRPNIENNIEFLIKQGVSKVYVVIGHLKEQFEYLNDKYKDFIELIYNPKYYCYNNIYSMYLLLEYIKDGFIVIEGDIVIHRYFDLPIKDKKSLYVTTLRENTVNEWIPTKNKEGYIERVDIVSEEKPSYIGISYYSEDATMEIIKEYNNFFEETEEKVELFWDDIMIKVLDKIFLEEYEIPKGYATEVDTFFDYCEALRKANT